MRATIATIAAFAATAAAAPTTRQTDYGNWDVRVTTDSAASGWRSRDVLAKYSGQNTTVHCTYEYEPWNNFTETASCSDPSFSYSLGSSGISLTQTVELFGGNVTISGSGPITFDCNSPTARLCTGSTTVEVSTAVA